MVDPHVANGMTLYAHGQRHCYRVTVGPGGKINQVYQPYEPAGGCGPAQSYEPPCSACYDLGDYRFGSSTEQRFEGGTGCGWRGPRKSYIKFMAVPGATKITASVSESPTCTYHITLSGPCASFIASPPPPPPSPPVRRRYFKGSSVDEVATWLQDTCTVLMSPLAPPFPAPPPRPSSPDAALCSNTCQYHSDGDCDDGGPGYEYTYCDLGTDCDDCTSRIYPPPSPPSPPTVPPPPPSPTPPPPPSPPPSPAAPRSRHTRVEGIEAHARRGH